MFIIFKTVEVKNKHHSVYYLDMFTVVFARVAQAPRGRRHHSAWIIHKGSATMPICEGTVLPGTHMRHYCIPKMAAL